MNTDRVDATPLMRQYYAIKEQYPQTLVLFQVGDFYELFFDDAKQASSFLGIALTKRGKINGEPIPLCGVPVHALDHYLAKLIKGGFKIAICDQLEEAKPGKVVDRGVTRVLTPGTLTDSKLLDEKSASYLFSFFPGDNSWGLLFAELLTAQLYATVLPADAHKSLESELIRFFPDEIILPNDKNAKLFEHYFKQLGYCITLSNDNDNAKMQEWLTKFPHDLVYKINDNESLKYALSHFYMYMSTTQQNAVEQFKTLQWYAPDDFLILDQATQHNLELVRNLSDNTRKNSLFEMVDGALTPAGSRMIKKWIMRPLVKQQAIMQRQEVIHALIADVVVLQNLEQQLQELGDVERVVGRIALRRALLQDFLHIKHVLALLSTVYQILEPLQSIFLIRAVLNNFADFNNLYQLLEASLNDDATKDWMIKNNFDQPLDYYRDLATNATQKIVELESKEQSLTGISSLKIRYNNVYGYYIEVTKTHMDAIPDRYVRQQTLVGRERYMTSELQQLQHEITRAQAEVGQLEKIIFDRIKNEVAGYSGQLRKLAHALANLDALVGFARVSYHNNYIQPIIHDAKDIMITAGRHPVVERIAGHGFIPNDTQLDQQHATWIITGPNMGGKSTYLRQVALIQIMTQIGIYVPAQAAQLPIVDRIFTRIGASDNLAQGKSTFLVEMEETASICTQATERSLVILDEVGRGTSTFDGLSIAQAVIEYIHTVIKARCLFATHYHELALLPDRFASMASYYMASKKTERGLQFLYKIKAGVADGSFGLDVAQLAQVPQPVIHRARAILHDLQQHSHTLQTSLTTNAPQHSIIDQQLIQLQTQLYETQKKLAALEQIDYDNLSPKAAFDFLWKFREL